MSDETPRDQGGLGLAPLVELSPEQEAALDADPRERLYENHKIEAPTGLASTLGAFTKLLLLQGVSSREEYLTQGVAFFEQLKLARSADPRIDFERFLSAQLKMMAKKVDPPSSYDFESEFAPPPGLAELLHLLAKEAIRFQPGDMLSFCLGFFTSAAEDSQGSPDLFLAEQRRVADEKNRVWEAERKRARLAKEKKAAAAAGKA